MQPQPRQKPLVVELPFSNVEMAWVIGFIGIIGTFMLAFYLKSYMPLLALYPLSVIVWVIARVKEAS